MDDTAVVALFACTILTLLQPPPLLATLPAVISTFDRAGEDDSAAAHLTALTALAASCESAREARRKAHRDVPRPEIGGQRITDEWLASLKDREVKWRFRCAFTRERFVTLC